MPAMRIFAALSLRHKDPCIMRLGSAQMQQYESTPAKPEVTNDFSPLLCVYSPHTDLSIIHGCLRF